MNSRTLLASALLAVGGSFVLPLTAVAAVEYAAVEVPTLPGYPYPRARAINDAGHLAGTNYTCPFILSCLSRAVLFDGTTLTDMSAEAVAAVPPGFFGFPFTLDLNNAGQSVFRMAVVDVGIYNYYWDAEQTLLISGDPADNPSAAGGPLVPFPPPPGIVWAINDNGTVVGTVEHMGVPSVFLWEPFKGVVDIVGVPAGFTSIGVRDINVHGHFVGGVSSPSVNRGYIHADGVFTILDPPPGHTASAAFTVNDDGFVAGSSDGPDGVQSVVMWRDGALVGQAAPAYATNVLMYPEKINSAREVVGYFWPTADEFQHFGFRWKPGEPIVTLSDAIANVPGLNIWAAEGINDAGQLAAWGDYPDFTGGAFVLTPSGPGIPGDIDGDGVVGTADLLTLLSEWGPCGDCASCPADLDGDCVVGTSDLLILLGNWG